MADLPHNSVSMKPSTLMISQSQMPRDAGHGDFCFGRQGNFMVGQFMVLRRSRRLQEKTSFQRGGPFPFFRLPPEIRRRILTFCLPCCSIDTLHPKGSTNIKFMDLEDFILQDPEYQASSVRKHAYRLSIQPTMSATLNERTTIKTIRDLANTSMQMRQEFGDLFWNRITLSISCFTTWGTTQALLEFLQERPAIHRGLKGLDIELDEEVWHAPSEVGRETLQKLGKYLARSIKLERLVLMFCISEEDLELVVPLLETSDIPQMIRQIVTNEFDMILSVYLNADPDEFESEADMEDYRDSLDDKYYWEIYHFFWPESLRPLEPKTDQEKYLHERSKLIASHRRARGVDAY